MRHCDLKVTLFLLIPIFLSTLSCGKEKRKEDKYLDGEFWRNQGLEGIIPFWHENVRDTVNGAYYLNLTREGEPVPPYDKYPAMISRQVFGFTSAYLLSGEEKYLETAREGADYLLKYAWDSRYGGWFDRLDQVGNPMERTKSVPNQLYTNVGLSLFYFATGDENVLNHIKKSIDIQRTHSKDKNGTGYFQTLTEDLRVSDSSKSKHGHYGYTSSLLIYMMMITRDEEIGNFAEELMDISFDKMRDTINGWFLGFPGPYDSGWKLSLSQINNKEVVSAGGQLTAVLSLLRLYELTGNEKYRKTGVVLGEKLNQTAWDSKSGGWFDIIERMPPHTVQDSSRIYWWLQSYGMFIQLHLYNITGDKHYLDNYKIMASFWSRYFVDREYGGSFLDVTPEGTPLTSNKAAAWKASYHEMENSLLNYLYSY
jgi:mannose/cellobiose epimerase-like protein (N-acyl-D-glucosamine 2-epimerase family)